MLDILKSLSVIVLCVLISSCVTTQTQQNIPSAFPVGKTAHQGIPVHIAQYHRSLPVSLKKVIVSLSRGEYYGKLFTGVGCKPYAQMKWRIGSVKFSTEEITQVFTDELRNAGYQAIGNENQIFRSDDSNISFYLGAAITGIDANICVIEDEKGFSVKGNIHIAVNWEVYSPITQSVVGRFTTEGSHNTNQQRVKYAQELFETAFGVATRNLLANQDYARLVTSKEKYTPQIFSGELVQLVVNTEPADAQVALLEPNLVYYPGIQLVKGEYRIRVSKEKHETIIKSVQILDRVNYVNVTLKRNQIDCDTCLGIDECHFIDNGDGTVTDKTTDLTWMRCSYGQNWNGRECINKPELFYHPSIAWRRGRYPNSQYANYNDWRVPRSDELLSIVQNECSSPKVNSEVFPGTPETVFLTSDPGNCTSRAVPGVNFSTGIIVSIDCNTLGNYRLVRAAR